MERWLVEIAQRFEKERGEYISLTFTTGYGKGDYWTFRSFGMNDPQQLPRSACGHLDFYDLMDYVESILNGNTTP